MSSTIKFVMTQREIDADDNVTNELQYSQAQEFTVSQKSTFSIPSSNSWITIPFGRVTTSVCVKVITDETISMRVDGGTQEITVLSGYFNFGEHTELEIKNNSGQIATIFIEIYGS